MDTVNAMNWLPAPHNFRENLRATLAITDVEERLCRLAALARCRLSYLEIIQLDHALAKTAVTTTTFARIRLAILSSCTIDHLLPSIRIAGLRHRLWLDIYVGPYGQYRQELLDASRRLHDYGPDFILLSLTSQEAISGIPLDASLDHATEKLSQSVSEFRDLWGVARQSLKATVIQQAFLDVSEPLFGNYDRQVPGAPTRLIGQLNDQLAEASAQDHVLWLDVARASARDGLDAWFDITRWLQGKIEIAPQSAAQYGDLIARLISASRGQSKKCLVLDLDNTLWGGVIGDDGIDGIVLGQGSAAGEAHAGLQRYAKQLKDRGIILAVCSKNDLAIAEAVFRDHPEMVLRRPDIAAFVANWNDKAENIRAIAEQLNIGLDSLVFLDDNPAERTRIRESLPMVAVPELPADPAYFVRCLADAGYFEATSFTDEDRQRADLYVANAQRDTLRSSSQSVEDFLRGLDMSVILGPIMPITITRITQLLNKTNQFNTTTRRYAVEDIARIATSPDHLALQFRLIDRFGDNGLVSAMLFRPVLSEPAALEIDNWVMSCRVFGRQLEFEAMNAAVIAARARGIQTIWADYVPTKKNAVISNLYENLGFTRVYGPMSAEGASRWNLDLAEYKARLTYIRSKEQ